MNKTKFSRRNFIKGLGITAGVSFLGAPSDSKAQRTNCVGIVRKNIKSLTAAEINAFKNGVQVMKSRPITDPTSWAYQAAIHGTISTPAQIAWNTCKHSFLGSTIFFLSWHRMYLCFFERILRKASGNPKFGLPYWDYSDLSDPDAQRLPAVFRTPANSSNPLYVSERGDGFNAGTSFLPPQVVDTNGATDIVPFFQFSDWLESTPHNDVHITMDGWMGSPDTAAQDPIFWMHHCNIDRLWNVWLSKGGGRQNPVTNANWKNTPFKFFNESGQLVQMTQADLLKPFSSACRYCYDNEVGMPDFNIRVQPDYLKILLGDCVNCDFTLGPVRKVLEIRLNEKAREAAKKLGAANKPEDAPLLKLVFEGVKAAKPVGFFYEVYLNLPANTKNPNYKMENYAGNLSLFGADSTHSNHNMPGMKEEKLVYGVFISKATHKMLSKNLSIDKSITITLVPTGAVDEKGERLPIRSDVKIEVEKVSLVLEEPKK